MNHKTVIYPGTFDPIHMGHIDIVERASRIFDEVIIAIAVNIDKNPLFTIQERMDLADGATSHLKNIKTLSTEGLIADFAKEHSACGLIRGLRHVSDFEFEFQMATMNNHLNPDVSTLLMVTSDKYVHINSSMVKNVSKLNGDIAKYVPKNVLSALKTKFN
tara:strand:+ start:206 stop:688 length:483 start_codon:yes stop_codon:yes gene_type:complete